MSKVDMMETLQISLCYGVVYKQQHLKAGTQVRNGLYLSCAAKNFLYVIRTFYLSNTVLNCPFEDILMFRF